MSQHMDALHEANRVRLARCALKRAIYAREVSPTTVLREIPWEARTMPVAELLRAQRRWGDVRVRTFLAGLLISESRTVGELTARQREEIAFRLAPFARAA